MFVPPVLKRVPLFLFVSALLVAVALHAAETVPASPMEALGVPGGSVHPRWPDKAGEILRAYDAHGKSQAQKLMDEWKNKDKKSPWPWVVAAHFSLREGKPKQALGQTQKALDKSSSCADAYYVRGQAYEALKKPMDAANEYRAALLSDTDFADAQTALNHVRIQLGDVSAPVTQSSLESPSH